MKQFSEQTDLEVKAFLQKLVEQEEIFNDTALKKALEFAFNHNIQNFIGFLMIQHVVNELESCKKCKTKIAAIILKNLMLAVENDTTAT